MHAMGLEICQCGHSAAQHTGCGPGWHWRGTISTPESDGHTDCCDACDPDGAECVAFVGTGISAETSP